MHPFLYVTTAFLVGAFLFLCVGASRALRGREQPRPFIERAAMAGIFAIVGWQALNWLWGDQPAASQARVIGVWVQLLCAFGSAAVMIAQGWFFHPRTKAE
jgi:hypothetical protein